MDNVSVLIGHSEKATYLHLPLFSLIKKNGLFNINRGIIEPVQRAHPTRLSRRLLAYQGKIKT